MLRKEQYPQRRARLTCIIWQFRDAAVLLTLALALNDSAKEVWKEALDGLVCIGTDEGRRILNDARDAVSKTQDLEKLQWIEEAIEQMAESTTK